MKNLKFILVIFGLIILYIILDNKTKVDPVDEWFDQTINGKWREPNSKEFLVLGRILILNEIKVCGEYYVKDPNSYFQTYIIACTPDGDTWQYFSIDLDDIKVLNVTNGIGTKLQPPR